MREEAEKRWGEVGGGLPKFKNTNNQPRPSRLLYQQSRTQHSTRRNMSSQGKTRDKTRQAKTRQAKTKSALPPSLPACRPGSKTSAHSPLFLFKISTNTHIHILNRQTLSLTLSVICVQCCVSAHTRHERLPASSSGQLNVKREETKNGEAKTRDESASVLNGDSYHVFHFHQPSPLPTQPPRAFPPLPPRRHETRRKSSRCRGIFVRLKQPK